MKQYPSFDGPKRSRHIGDDCIAFEKYDGSNLRFEWNSKRGWYKYGTRKLLFDTSHPIFGEAIALFNATLANDIENVLKSNLKAKQAIVFAEFFGSNSFAGQHYPRDEKQLVLIDAGVDKKGLLDPDAFVENFDHLDHVARVIYEGQMTEEFIQSVRDGAFGVGEGVVCKGGTRHKRWMCKIKTDTYRNRLKEIFKDGWEQYWENA